MSVHGICSIGCTMVLCIDLMIVCPLSRRFCIPLSRPCRRCPCRRFSIPLSSTWRMFCIPLSSPWRRFCIALSRPCRRVCIPLACPWHMFCIPLSSLWSTLVIRLCGRIRWINGCLLLHPGKNIY